MDKTDSLVRFDSTTTVTGLDFIAKSLAQMEISGSPLCPDAVTGNMSPEQKAIFLARLGFHRNRLKSQQGGG